MKAALVIGVDTEFVRAGSLQHANTLSARDLAALGGKGNSVLCYSAAILNPETGQRASAVLHTTGPGYRHRLAFSSFLGVCIKAAVDAGLIEAAVVEGAGRDEKLPLTVVGHFTRADLPGFRDFHRLKRLFDGIRKTYASIQRPAIMDVKPLGRRVAASITLVDTALIAPANARSLKALGKTLGFPKLEIPTVMDEQGAVVPGIERMDIVRRLYPDLFDAYAKRDAEVAVEWFMRFTETCQDWGLSKVPPTVGALAVAKFKAIGRDAGTDMEAFMGREKVKGTRSLTPVAVLANNASLIANAFFGGRNEAYAHGVYDGTYTDIDLRGAYTTGLAQFRTPAWDMARHTTALDRLALVDVLAVAHIRFTFPATVRFPVFAVPVENGLVFPLTGETYATAPELAVAVALGASIEVLDGLLIPWADDAGHRPFVAFTAHINAERKRHTKGTPEELLAKEAGNSLYGKLAQGVASHKTVLRKTVKVFDTREGTMGDLPGSNISNAIYAALTTGLLRAVLTEILNALPRQATILSATTDGFLTDATTGDVAAACAGPVARYFGTLRAMVDPKGDTAIIEPKHTAHRVLVMKTRGALSLLTDAGAEPILARAGHKMETQFEDKAAEVEAWWRLFKARDATTELRRKDFIDLATQWHQNEDLITVDATTRVNLDFDMKRRPVGLHDMHGLIRFTTEPWPDAATYQAEAKRFNRWRALGNTLKTTADWHRFAASALTFRQGRHTAAHTPFERAVIIAAASWPMTREKAVEVLAAVGITTTAKALYRLKGRAVAPAPVLHMTPEDTAKAKALAHHLDPTVMAALGVRLETRF